MVTNPPAKAGDTSLIPDQLWENPTSLSTTKPEHPNLSLLQSPGATTVGPTRCNY